MCRTGKVGGKEGGRWGMRSWLRAENVRGRQLGIQGAQYSFSGNLASAGDLRNGRQGGRALAGWLRLAGRQCVRGRLLSSPVPGTPGVAQEGKVGGDGRGAAANLAVPMPGLWGNAMQGEKEATRAWLRAGQVSKCNFPGAPQLGTVAGARDG